MLLKGDPRQETEQNGKDGQLKSDKLNSKDA
jgi:hypothetical protein